MSRRRWAILAALALAAAACGGGDQGNEVIPTRTAPQTVTVTTPRAVGTMLRVWNPVASVNRVEAFAGDDIPAGGTISTDPSGWADFDLKQIDKRKIEFCRILRDSEVQVLPMSDVLLKYVDGTTWCSTDPDPATAEVFIDKHGAQFETQDPVFGITVEPDRTLVKVWVGFVAVRSLTAGGEPVLVGPGQQSVIFRGDPPQSPEAFAFELLDSLERQAVVDVAATFRGIDFGRPNAGDSPALRRIFQRRRIVVALDPQAVGDGGTALFVHRFTGFLAESWQIKPDLRQLQVADGLAALERGDLDLVISPEVLPGAESVPLFDDTSERRWSIGFETQDPTFKAALTGFLVDALESGRYDGFYAESFGRSPAYASLRSLVGP